MADTHTVMPKKLAQALMEAGMKHFDIGGSIANVPKEGPDPTIQYLDNNGGVSGILGGLAPQNDFNASTPNITTQNFAPQIANLQGQQQQAYNQQQNLAQALLAQSQGKGPNPALAQLYQTTAQNVQQQAALAASQRGASSNPALIARQAAQTGAQAQQQAADQAATLGAQQQLAAQQQLGGVYNNTANQALQGQSIEQGAQSAQNNAIDTASLGAQGINANVAAQNTSTKAGVEGGIFNALGGGASSLFYKGGKVQKLADGGDVEDNEKPVNDDIGIANFGQSSPASNLPAPWQNPTTDPFASSSGGKSGGGGGGIMSLAALLSKGGQVPFSKKYLKGGKVEGKAEVEGDSPKNDTQPALLSPGEEVLPRSVTMAEDAPEKAKEFVEMLQKKQGKKGGYKEVAGTKKSLEERIAHLEKLCGGGYA